MTAPIDLPESLDSLLVRMDSDSRKDGLPWVTLSYAQSLDGSIAARRGAPLVLSGPATLQITHHLRARHQAILIGIGTLLDDDPRLNVRLVPGDDPRPLVLDNHLRTPPTARLLGGQNPPWIFTSRNASPENETALVRAGARVIRADTERVEPGAVLQVLRQDGIHSVMVEGGARVITSFLQARLVNLMILTIAPRFVGGLRAVESLLPDDGPRLDEFSVQPYGNDLLVWGRPRWAAEK